MQIRESGTSKCSDGVSSDPIILSVVPPCDEAGECKLQDYAYQ
ncbi:MAG: hypothetical protein IPH77_19535 [Ignavibacteria bacterium]|nr:hypothetical protein [Ignavibacteria bacterium]